MSKDKSIEKFISEYEYWLAKYKFIQEKYPKAIVYRTYAPITFASNLVNSKYTHFNISKGFNTLFIEPYLEENFKYNNIEETLIVYTLPRRNRLAHIT